MKGRDWRTDKAAHYAQLPSAFVAAHELKAPLSLMRQILLRLEDPTLSPQKVAQLQSRLRITNEQLLQLTRDLTKTARLEESLFSLEPIDTGELFQSLEQQLLPVYEAHQRRLVSRVGTTPPLVLANRDLLTRIMVNFADNALKYADQKGEVRLFVQRVNKNKTIRLSVRDYGPQLTKAVIKTIFAGGSKNGTHSVPTRPDSSGLGLYIADQFARAMEGEVGVTRHRDGTSFYVDLPQSHQLSLL